MNPTRLPLPSGFCASGVAAGLKPSGRRDLALLVSSRPAAFAALTTTHRLRGPAARHTEQAAGRGVLLRAVVVNSGVSNTLTGKRGEADHARVRREAEALLRVPPNTTLFHSTGVVGALLPVSKILRGLRAAVRRLSPRGGLEAARAILTTDTRVKVFSRRVAAGRRSFRLTGLAKGSGMIHPRMATLLVYLMTDLAAPASFLRRCLREAARDTFQSITVDGDTSTSDAVVLLANGASGVQASGAAAQAFRKVLGEACRHLAKEVVRDGEGATRLVEIRVTGARSPADAQRAAEAAATSLLVKTALWGADPNWGRVLAAVGRSGAACREDRCRVWIGPHLLFDRGRPTDFSRAQVRRSMRGREVGVRVDLGLGRGFAVRYTCDLSPRYVTFNGRYTT